MKKNLRPHELASFTQKFISSAALLLCLATLLMSAKKDGGQVQISKYIHAHMMSF